jgi:hypothetical protein
MIYRESGFLAVVYDSGEGERRPRESLALYKSILLEDKQRLARIQYSLKSNFLINEVLKIPFCSY